MEDESDNTLAKAEKMDKEKLQSKKDDGYISEGEEEEKPKKKEEKDEEKKKEKKKKKDNKSKDNEDCAVESNKETEGEKNEEKEGKKEKEKKKDKEKDKDKKKPKEEKLKLAEKYGAHDLDKLKMKLEKVDSKIAGLLENKAEIVRLIKEAEEKNHDQADVTEDAQENKS